MVNYDIELYFFNTLWISSCCITTFFCYALFCLIYYVFYKKVCREILNGVQLYDAKDLFIISVFLVISGIIVTFINKLLLKYSVLLLGLILLIVNRKKYFMHLN